VGRCDPVIRSLLRPDTVLKTHRGPCFLPRCCPKSVMAKRCRSAGLDTGRVGGPQAHDDAPRGATGRAAGGERGGAALHRLQIAGVCLQDQLAQGSGRESTAGMANPAMPDYPAARRQHRLEEPTEQCQRVEPQGAWMYTAGCAVGQGPRAVRERDEAIRGDGDCADLGSEGVQGGVGVGHGPAGAVPGDSPASWRDLPEQSRCAHVLFPHGTIERGEGVDGDQEGRSGGPPRRTVL
jgi:hypothetical protein